MIADKSRSGWFGASDTSYVVGNRNTDSFKKWWLEKLDIRKNMIHTKAMDIGNHLEGKILDTIEGVRKDHQILIPELRLRVNYDGDKDGTIYEVKTSKDFKLSKAYWRQAQVEMYAMQTKDLYIVSYNLTEQEYKNYFAEIETERIVFTKVEYDPEFIETVYLPNLKELAECLTEGRLPKEKK